MLHHAYTPMSGCPTGGQSGTRPPRAAQRSTVNQVRRSGASVATAMRIKDGGAPSAPDRLGGQQECAVSRRPADALSLVRRCAHQGHDGAPLSALVPRGHVTARSYVPPGPGVPRGQRRSTPQHRPGTMARLRLGPRMLHLAAPSHQAPEALSLDVSEVYGPQVGQDPWQRRSVLHCISGSPRLHHWRALTAGSRRRQARIDGSGLRSRCDDASEAPGPSWPR